jgi:NTP pyrophosphatase (non-canonical NTP hydrolase)
MKDINKYGAHVMKSWFPPKIKKYRTDLSIMGFGLAGESGEVMEHLKKYLRDGTLNEEALKKELGDVVFYWARICRYFGFSPSSVLDAQIEKTKGRKKRGTQRGSGDNR